MDDCEYVIWLDEPLYSDDGKEIKRTINLPWCRVIDRETLQEHYNIGPISNISKCPYESKYCPVRDLIDRARVYCSIFSEGYITENTKL